MSRAIKAVLIDPYKEEVTDIEYDASDYKNIYPLIHCDVFTIVRLENDDDVIVDDEGLLKLNRDTKFFMMPTYQQPLAGYGLITGVDHADGETIAAHRAAEYYRRKIQFLDMAMVQVLGYFR